jgi:hypothetical protein
MARFNFTGAPWARLARLPQRVRPALGGAAREAAALAST